MSTLKEKADMSRADVTGAICYTDDYHDCRFHATNGELNISFCLGRLIQLELADLIEDGTTTKTEAMKFLSQKYSTALFDKRSVAGVSPVDPGKIGSNCVNGSNEMQTLKKSFDEFK